MSKIIKYNDYIQINPDRNILSLDKEDKIILTDNLLRSAYTHGKGLLVTYDLSHSGRRINNRIYSTKGQERGIDSLTNPYPKPILKNHDQMSEPIGRFVGGEWQSLHNEASDFFGNSQQALDIYNAFSSDEPERIYKTMKKNGLLLNKKWPGLGRMRVQANITDEESIKKFLDGRYLTFSAGSTTDKHVCSICQADWAKEGMCEHRHGQTYDDELCVFLTGDFIVLEGSVVNTPADDLSQVVSMEIKDSENVKDIKDTQIPYDIIMSDSFFNNMENKDGLQTTKQEHTTNEDKEGAYKKEEKPNEEKRQNVKKKYDHSMSISDQAMMELHESGETYITQRGDGETMVIRVTYSGRMRKDFDEFDFDLELDEFTEELLDEKMFKVPSGAKGNAQKVLNWKKEKGSEVKGMTPVGWARARQLATKSEIGLSTVKRMAAFNRHRKNAEVAPEYKSEPWKDRGYVAWLGWGGTSGIDWAVRISAANDADINENIIADFDEDAYRSSPKGKGAKTPAKPSERIKGSKKNAEGSASKSNSKIEVGSVLESLKSKVSEHNKKYGKEEGKKVSLGMLKAVYRRGAGAFSSTHRPGMSRSGWGVARVNAFLKLVRSGRPSNPKYKQDNDLLPSGHPKKSNTKTKDFNMSEKIKNEDLELELDAKGDTDLEIEAVEPTEEQQAVHDESLSNEDSNETKAPKEVEPEEEEETLDGEDSVDVDWELLDMGLNGFLAMEDKMLSTEERNKLPDSAFCGPDRSFPVNDCAHVTAARRLINRAKLSDAAKAKVLACVDKKAKNMSCDKSEDYLDLENKFNTLQSQYNELEDKFKEMLQLIADKNQKQQKDEEKLENVILDDVNEKKDNILDAKVESPSNHAEDVEKANLNKEDSLPEFEKNIVKTFKQIKDSQGPLAANAWLGTKIAYLPRGFDPENF